MESLPEKDIVPDVVGEKDGLLFDIGDGSLFGEASRVVGHFLEDDSEESRLACSDSPGDSQQFILGDPQVYVVQRGRFEVFTLPVPIEVVEQHLPCS